MPERNPLKPLLLLAGLKVVTALAVIVLSLFSWEAGLRGSFIWLVVLGQIVAMSTAGTLLVVGGRHDRRAVHLGYFFVLLATALAPHDALGLTEKLGAPWSGLILAFSNLRLEVFLTVFLWLFVRDFPAIPMSFQLRRRVDHTIRFCWLASGALLLVQLYWLLGFLTAAPESAPAGPYASAAGDFTEIPSRAFILALCLAGGGFLAWKARRSAGGERRRGRLFILAVVGGGSLVAIGALVDLVTRAPRLYLEEHPIAHLAALLVANALLVAIPFTTAYAVLVEHILDMRGIARRALQHGLTRAAVKGLAALPLLVLAVYLVNKRHLELGELVSSHPVFLLGLAALALAALRYHSRMLEAIDRHFFPEQYNARRVLTQLTHQIRGSRDLEQLAHLIGRAVDLAWQIDRVALLTRGEEGDELVDTTRELPALDTDGGLVELLVREQQPLEIDLSSWSSELRALPELDRHWLVDTRTRVIVPSFAMDGGLNALIVLGRKPGGMPFVTEELQLLGAAAAAAGLVIELLELKHGGSSPEADEDEILASSRKAMECLVCGQIFPPETQHCQRCKVDLTESTVPYALRRMFRFEERIGTGGMAVVFRATDLKLGRSVAVKTLPRVSPEAAVRLQREARTAATVSHPGLAAIYGIETWEGVPMLILELLEGGTLSDRLAQGSLLPLEVIDTGQTLAQALEVIHNLGILHRDIKPSNIGYTRHGDAKLLDFGIARIYDDLRQDPEDPSEVLTVEKLTHPSEPMVGTLCYFSPEALDEETPDPSFDLWSLTVVLYEALTGTNLFFTPRLADILDAIRRADVPDVRSKVPECPESLAEFFKVELHRDKARRSQSGREYASRLKRIWRELGSQSGYFMARVS